VTSELVARARYSVVIPVYGNEPTLAAVVESIAGLAGRLDGGLEVVVVVDGSPDGSLALLRRLLPEAAAFSSQLAALWRNFGSFSAIKAGLALACGDYVAVMAADMQEPTSLIEDFFTVMSKDGADIAVGRRTARRDPLPTRVLSRTYWGLYRRFVLREIPRSGVDVFGCTRQVADQLIRLDESHTSLVGLLYWVGFRRVEIPYERRAREIGTSGWSFRRYLLDSV
jgi:polyisoprenyl-phosphate glycosyltransferase